MFKVQPEDHSITGELLNNECKRISAFEFNGPNKKYYEGKVRNTYRLDRYNMLLIEHTDKLSAYDSHICDIYGKGEILNHMSCWWMNQTKHIIPNHYIYHRGPYQLAKLCRRIDLEVIVRGYITGSSKTSLWTLYQEGNHNVYSINLPSGLKKNQKLPEPVVTPTTKGETDEPILDEEIVNRGLLRKEQWEYIKSKALELYNYGAAISASKGLILVDTKYEFGIYEPTGEIMLIDEIHTGDSSRYWMIDSYQTRLESGQEPINFDKEHIRRYIDNNHPEFKKTPLNQRKKLYIPKEEESNVANAYLNLYSMLTSNRLDLNNMNYMTISKFLNLYINNLAPLVIVISGSRSDIPAVQKVNSELDKHGVMYHNYYHSAHKETFLVMDIIQQYNNLYGQRKMLYIPVVGMSNALGGVIAANTKFPVINCPNFSDKDDQIINVNSSLQMPSKVPSAVILRPDNVAMFAKYILSL
jgi:fusion protein PurCD